MAPSSADGGPQLWEDTVASPVPPGASSGFHLCSLPLVGGEPSCPGAAVCTLPPGDPVCSVTGHCVGVLETPLLKPWIRVCPHVFADTGVMGTSGNADLGAGSLIPLCSPSQTPSSCVLSFLLPTSRLLVWIFCFGFALHFSHLIWCLSPCLPLSLVVPLGSGAASGALLSS